MYVLRKTLREFGEDQCTDLAAALTYYAVLAIAPALLAVVSLLGLVGRPAEDGRGRPGDRRRRRRGLGRRELKPILTQLTEAPAAGLALVLGLLWPSGRPPGTSRRSAGA